MAKLDRSSKYEKKIYIVRYDPIVITLCTDCRIGLTEIKNNLVISRWDFIEILFDKECGDSDNEPRTSDEHNDARSDVATAGSNESENNQNDGNSTIVDDVKLLSSSSSLMDFSIRKLPYHDLTDDASLANDQIINNGFQGSKFGRNLRIFNEIRNNMLSYKATIKDQSKIPRLYRCHNPNRSNEYRT
ncbi:hypothetical protein RCL_jg19073.t3 [Rhizophagus clarus]|uniref:Uncharacterized protein n=1 Tax=Rhizophagus clarus TaxID=94130 RepID=A0A8H3LZF7_9GLOM|nr:hypothetical protein RCL_jg19073.t3 [Rhizophagus clarus]